MSICNERKNFEYAKILLEDYAGENGEDTAIHRYLYQSYLEKDLKEPLLQIAKTEMRHLHILGTLIYQLGYLPSYYTVIPEMNTILPWTSSYVDYNMNWEEFLILDIEEEYQAIARYQKHIEEIPDPSIQEILRQIIEEEKEHISILQKLYQEKRYKKEENNAR